MNEPVNNTLINEALPLNIDIKLETEQENVAETICLFLPHHTTETDTSFEHKVDLSQLKEEPLDIIDGDIEKDPLAIEETNLVKSENVKVENEEVTIEESTKNFIACNRCVNSSVHDGAIKENCSECMCAYGDVKTEENLFENSSTENKLPIQEGNKSVCEYCNETVNCKCYLNSDINLEDKEEINNSNVSLIADNDLKTDLIAHNEEKDSICNFSQKSFNQSSNLNIHTKEKSYVCNFCQKDLNCSSSLNRHLNIHTKEKNYVCNFCQKVFYHPSNLKKHLNIHTKEKNYVCNFCQKVFSSSSSLKKHLNIHTKEKSYVCNVCQKILNCPSSLKRHLNIHTNEKNYVCNFCQKSFNQTSSLKSHLNIHTKEKSYICYFCHKAFNNLSNVKKHINLHNKEKNCL